MTNTAAWGRRSTLLVGAATALALGGCAERRLISAPDSSPSATTWAAVWLAGALAAAVVGVLLTLPAWRSRVGARLSVTVLTIQTGAVLVTGVVLAAAALRSRQLLDQPIDAEPAVALLRLSRVDGDASFLALMVLIVTVLSALVATISAVAAQMAAGTDRIERSIASALLAIELGVAGFAVVLVVLGERGGLALAGAALFPVLAAATVTCWPHHTPA